MSTRGSSKSKSKKPLETTLGKAPRCVTPVDISHIRKPIETSIFGLDHVLNLYETATDEVRRYVTYECEIMYECRICRTIFRSLANFILHKRNYCQESFKTGYSQNFPENPTKIFQDEELEPKCNKRQTMPSPPSTELKQSSDSILELLLDNSRSKENKKCLDSVVCLLKEKQTSALITDQCLTEDISNESLHESENFDLQNDIALQKIKESNTGVFQTMLKSVTSEFNNANLMKSEVMEIHSILDNNEAILGRDGKIIENKVKTNIFVCTICNNKFSTKKTLACHIKFKHNNTRMVYQCPQCKDTFANSWSVFRHLYKIHHKTTAQVKKLRNQIHSNVVRKDEIPEEKSPCRSRANSLTETRNREVENREWMDNFELDNDVQRCGGCGRKFERKAALHSHSQFCSKRIAVCNSLKEGKKLLTEEKQPNKVNGNVTEEIVLQGSKRRKPLIAQKLYRVDYISNKIDDNLTNEKIDEIASDKNNPHLRIIQKYKEDSDPVIEIVDSGDEDFQGFDTNCNKNEEKHLNASKNVLEKLENNCDTKILEEFSPTNSPDCIYISSDDDKLSLELKELDELNYLSDSSVSNNKEGNKRKRENMENEENKKFKIIDVIIDGNEGLEDDSNLMLETHSMEYVDFDHFTCLPCKQSFQNKLGLMNHMGRHFNWHRYQCLDCFYTSYDKIICEEHVRAKHNIEDLETVQTVVQPLPVFKTLELSSNFVDFAHKSEKTKEETNKELDSSNSKDNVTDTINKENVADVKQSENNNQDPVLMNMIMEVIFGGSSGNSTEDATIDSNSSDSATTVEKSPKVLSKSKSESLKKTKMTRKCIKVKSVEISKPSKIEVDNKDSSEFPEQPPQLDDSLIVKPLEVSKWPINCEIKKSRTEDEEVTTELQSSDSDYGSPSKSPKNNTKAIPLPVRDTTRPVRNRVIPIQKDFLYDMKMLKQKLSKDGEIINIKDVSVIKKQKNIKTYLGRTKQQSKSPDRIEIDLCDSNSNLSIKEDVLKNSKPIDKSHVTAD